MSNLSETCINKIAQLAKPIYTPALPTLRTTISIVGSTLARLALVALFLSLAYPAATLPPHARISFVASSVYVALVPPIEITRLIALPSSPPENIHLTLAFLGSLSIYAPTELASLSTLLSTFAARQSPLDGLITGFDQFAPTPTSHNRPVFYRHLDIPGLSELRTSLISHLHAAGFVPSQDFSFLPHLTLADYIPTDLPPPLLRSWHVTHLTLFAGADRKDFPFRTARF